MYLIPKKGSAIDFVINTNELFFLKEICERANISLPILIISTFQFLIFKLTGEHQSIVGINTNLRDREDIKGVMGFLINTIFLRHKIRGKESFVDFVKEVNMSYIKALRYKMYSLDNVLKDSDVSIELAGSLFFNIISNEESSLQLTENMNFIQMDKNYYPFFDIDLHVHIYNNAIGFQCQYKTDLFKDSTIEYILSQYLLLLKELRDYANIVL